MPNNTTKVISSKKKSTYSGPFVKININGQTVYLLGTAHISQSSIDDVKDIISNENPSIVCVELCKARYESLSKKNRWENLDLFQVIKERKIYLLMASVLLSIFQKKIGAFNKIKPGEEFQVAIKEAKKKKLNLEFIDRDVQITLKRAWQKAGFFGKTFIFSEIIASLFVKTDISSKEIEQLKQSDVLENIFKSIPKKFKSVLDIIIKERDQYMAQKIQKITETSPKKSKILAVVGAGHLKGIETYLKGPQTSIEKLEEVPKASVLKSIFKLIIPIIIISTIFLYFTGLNDINKILNGLIYWVSIKFTLVFIVTLFLGAHIITAFCAGLTAPISNFNPIFKPGWVAALLEAFFRKPKVSDFNSIQKDSETVLGFLKNRVTRIFILLTIPQFTSSIGSGLALWYISTL